MFGLSIFAVCAALLAIQFKGIKNDFGLYIILAASVVIIICSATKLFEIVGMIQNINKITNIGGEYVEILLKITGITYLSEFAANICLDCGFFSLSEQVRIFGKITVLYISVPIINSLVNTIGGLYG